MEISLSGNQPPHWAQQNSHLSRALLLWLGRRAAIFTSRMGRHQRLFWRKADLMNDQKAALVIVPALYGLGGFGFVAFFTLGMLQP
jgi:hypothetical protein